ncbi:MAG: Exoribonuclease II [Burkholderiaceae bacterium]|jgi:exoribonuclease-2|nr:MAG: Exoribonuclease II [Burkholderiaceae bacterium]
MFAVFEDAGKTLGGRVLSQAEASAQIEVGSGKRIKVKAANILLQFDRPAPTELWADAELLSAQIDLDLAWEFAPEDEFGFDDLAREYFSDPPSNVQRLAALLRLQEAPHYFRRAGKGRFKKAPAEIVQQALAAIEKKKQVQRQIDDWASQLAAGACPEPIRAQLYRILFRPDKNAPEYKAVVQAAQSSHSAPLALLQRAGAIASSYQFHWQRFLFENFPNGTGFPALAVPAPADDLPRAAARAYSIDDSHTTEIDDALSVQGLGSGTVVLGIHIAAPGLGIAPADALDQVARERLSTVYMPGYKVTMLPDPVVQAYTLQAGRDSPALSLYLTLDERTLEIRSRETRIERVPIAANLRHDQIDDIVTADWLAQPPDAGDDHRLAMPREQLSFLYRLAQHLKAGRELARGKPENANRPDFEIDLIDVGDGAPPTEPRGDEQVRIRQRMRGAPLDLIVAETMILANSSWGDWLAGLGVPAIYRSQASLAPGVKVRMGTRALPHAGLGVKSYAWSTSPLRRYVDLLNQWQIIACVRHGATAPLAAPFKPKSAELFAVLSAFDAAHAAYGAHQRAMERFWTLRYLQQQRITEIDATVLNKDGLARADALPLVLPVAGAQNLPRGTRLSVRLGAIDEITLDLHGTLLARLDRASEADDADGNGDEDDEPAAGPLAIAVDVDGAAEPDVPAAAQAADPR